MRSLARAVSLGDLVNRFGGSLAQVDSGQVAIFRLAPLASATLGDLSFLSNARYVQQALDCKASAIIVSEQDLGKIATVHSACWVLASSNAVYSTYASVSCWFAQQLYPEPVAGIHSSAVIAPSAKVSASAVIGPGVIIEAMAAIGDHCKIGAHCVVGAGAKIGAHSVLNPNVVVYADCTIGQRAIVHSGTVIGSDGFGFAREAGAWQKIAQLGAVMIGDDVEIGSNCSIDRGAIDDTLIGNGVKIDNLVQIAHNVSIGDGTAIAGCVGIAGSATIGKNCSLGGSAGVLGHLEICDNTIISSMSLVTRSIKKPGFYSGVFPLQDNADWERVAASLKQLPMLRQRLRELERMTHLNSESNPS